MSDVTITQTTRSVSISRSSGIVVSSPTVTSIAASSEAAEIAVVPPGVTNIIVERASVGVQGPPGTWEDEVPRSKRGDWVGSTVFYQGDAMPSALESDPVWRIKKVVFTGDDYVELWANVNDDGVPSESEIWDDRLSLVYS